VEEPKQPKPAKPAAVKRSAEEQEEEARVARLPGAIDLSNYERALKMSWVWSELERVRNVRPGFRWGAAGRQGGAAAGPGRAAGAERSRAPGCSRGRRPCMHHHPRQHPGGWSPRQPRASTRP
jgi:electron-transferring-flavoprotein dehydrogenase